MELTLTRASDSHVAVACGGAPSHAFDLRTLMPDETFPGRPPQPLHDPITYGKLVYQALFPAGSPAAQALTALPLPGHLLLVTTDDAVQAVPWELAYGPDGFLVCDHHLVRGLPAERRLPPPARDGHLHIVAVPSQPLEDDLPPLNIEGEWRRLAEVIRAAPAAVMLERTRPPTLEQTRRLVAGQHGRIIHFMGHGGQHEGQARLLFEKDDGRLDAVTAADFVRRVRGAAFLVTLNACVSARPGATIFSNLAGLLVNQGIPYALGMQFSISDDDARTFSRVLYDELAKGSSVEEAVYQARLAVAASSLFPWAVGVPVLYTSLAAPAPGQATAGGIPRVLENQPPLAVDALPRAEGGFQGRTAELRTLGAALTGDRRPRLLTIHGGGGLGKTALAREAMERFGFAWPGGAWGIALDNLPTRAAFVAQLGRFLAVAGDDHPNPAELERRVAARAGQPRTLLVLDNVETLVEAVEANDAAARDLADFLRSGLAGSGAGLLVTSRRHLGWPGEESLELGGLEPAVGGRLFAQSAPQRQHEIDLPLAESLSRGVEGHPLSLRLLGAAFNAGQIALAAFAAATEKHLLAAADQYKGNDHRHHTLYACLEISVRTLAADLTGLFSDLRIFHAPFLPETAAAILAPDDQEAAQQTILDRLYTLWQRGLLERRVYAVREGDVRFYHLLPVVRAYLEAYLPAATAAGVLQARFGAATAALAESLYSGVQYGDERSVTIAQQAGDDLRRGAEWVEGEAQGYFWLHLGWISQRLGDRQAGLTLTTQALDRARGQHPRLELEALNNMAAVYDAIGQPQRALALYEEALPIRRAVGHRAGEATTLNNMGDVYRAIGQPARALALFEEALPIRRAVGGRAGEATTLNIMGEVYYAIGQPQRALALYEEALPITRAVGDRAGEATTLNNMGEVYYAIGQPQRALALYEEALPIMRAVGNRATEATTLHNLAILLYQQLDRAVDAVRCLTDAVEVLQRTGLSRTASGATVEQFHALLAAMRAGKPLQ